MNCKKKQGIARKAKEGFLENEKYLLEKNTEGLEKSFSKNKKIKETARKEGIFRKTKTFFKKTRTASKEYIKKKH